MIPTEAEFRRLWDAFSQDTLDELTACGLSGLAAILIELKANKGFKASRAYLSWNAIQEILHLNSDLRDIFERWIDNLFKRRKWQ